MFLYSGKEDVYLDDEALDSNADNWDDLEESNRSLTSKITGDEEEEEEEEKFFFKPIEKKIQNQVIFVFLYYVTALFIAHTPCLILTLDYNSSN